MIDDRDAVGFDAVRSHCRFTSSEVNLLSLVADLICHALARLIDDDANS